MKYPDEFIERARESTNIVDIIGQYTQLKRSGHQYMGLCPFPDHPEKSPSFSVSEDKQVYHCFGCKKSGNVYTFLQTYSGLSFPEAIEFLARRASLPLPEPVQDPSWKRNDQDEKEQKAQTLKLNKLASQFFHQTFLKLSPDHPARQYAAHRGLSDEMITTFQIGYAPSEWQGLANHLQGQRASLKWAEKAGLIKARPSGGHFDLFRDRLMFPILSPMGDVVGFGGRLLDKSSEGPKYLNSPESPVFSKGRVFYGLHASAKHIRVTDLVIVVEGYMDLLALFGAGICNVVATLGTALTPHHARLLKRLTPHVLVLFDGDAAGQSAAERSLPILLEADLRVRGLFLPDNLDPDDFIHKLGVSELQKRIEEAPELFTLFLKHALRDYHGLASDKVTVVDRMAPILAATQDRRLRELYAREVAERLNVELDWLRRAVQPKIGKAAPRQLLENKKISQPPEEIEKAPHSQVIRVLRPPKAELIMVNLGLKSVELLNEIVDQGVVEQMSHPALQQILGIMISKYRQSAENFDKLTSFLAAQVDPSSAVTQHLEPTFAQAPLAEDRKLLQACFKSVQDQFLKARAKALALEMKQGPSPEHLEQFMNIQRDRRHLQRKDSNN